jgi:hypothetical protein
MMRKPLDSISVFLTLAGRDFDPDECTRAIGVAPTEVWTQRRDQLRARADLDNVVWSVGIDEASHDSVSDAVDAVLDLIWPRRDAIVRHAEQRGLRIAMSCTVRIHADAPEYSLSARTIQRLAELKAELVLDIFDHREEADR